MTAISVYELNGHLARQTIRPAGVMAAKIKTPHATSTHRTKHRLAHRPVYAVIAEVENRRGPGTRRVLAARFACGSSSESVEPIADAGDMNLCSTCERRASETPDRWTVYCYSDANDDPLYVGQTIDLDDRHRGHLVDKRSAAWIGYYASLRVLGYFEDRRSALAAERDAITRLRPRYNVQHNLRLVEGGESA